MTRTYRLDLHVGSYTTVHVKLESAMNYYHKKIDAPAEERIACDNCGEIREWDWSPSYDRFCLECLGVEADPRADRGDYEFHRDHC